MHCDFLRLSCIQRLILSNSLLCLASDLESLVSQRASRSWNFLNCHMIVPAALSYRRVSCSLYEYCSPGTFAVGQRMPIYVVSHKNFMHHVACIHTWSFNFSTEVNTVVFTHSCCRDITFILTNCDVSSSIINVSFENIFSLVVVQFKLQNCKLNFIFT